MADDDYQYQPKPLPGLKTFGGNQTDVGESPPQSRTIGTTDPTEDPFGNPAALPSYPGAGVEPALNCNSSAIIGTMYASAVVFPCENPTSSISDGGISMTLNGGTFDQNTEQGYVTITFGGKTISIDIASLPAASTASFREFEICAGQTIWVLSTAPA